MTDSHELPHPLLLDYLDGELDAERTRAVEVWIAEDASRGRLVAQHRAAWDLLGLADLAQDVPEASPEFSRTLVERAQAETPSSSSFGSRRLWRVAAVLLVGLGLWGALRQDFTTPQPFSVSSGSEVDLLEQYGDDLDIIADYQALQAIEGQLDGVLPR